MKIVLQKTTDEKLKALINQVLDKWDEKDGTVQLETGMFMGMANKASTGNSYIHTLTDGKIQSSDDFCIIEVGTTRNAKTQCRSDSADSNTRMTQCGSDSDASITRMTQCRSDSNDR